MFYKFFLRKSYDKITSDCFCSKSCNREEKIELEFRRSETGGVHVGFFCLKDACKNLSCEARSLKAS
jgi:hypothetical protein